MFYALRGMHGGLRDSGSRLTKRIVGVPIWLIKGF